MSKRTFLLVIVLSLLSALNAAHAQQREITGRVTSAATGERLAGVTVGVVGTTIAAITNAEGNFALRAPAPAVRLLVSMLGYRTREVAVPAAQNTASITLDVDVLRLEELVVTGRAGTGVARRNLANAVATLSAQDLEVAPVAESMEKMLQGRFAGANIEANSGAPGGGVQVRLRGTSTIIGQHEPLYVVDGVIVSNAAIASNQNAVSKSTSGSNPALTQDALVNRIADINPEEIERVEILKGASAAAIYGAKAANGVVVITTRRGLPGAARFTATQRFGVFALSNKMGLRTFETQQEAIDWKGAAAGRLFTGQSFDHEELLAGRKDLSTETSVSMSGGSETTRYYVNALWKNDDGIIANTGFDKQSFRLNLDQQVGQRLRLGLNTNLIHTQGQRGLTNNDNNREHWRHPGHDARRDGRRQESRARAADGDRGRRRHDIVRRTRHARADCLSEDDDESPAPPHHRAVDRLHDRGLQRRQAAWPRRRARAHRDTDPR